MNKLLLLITLYLVGFIAGYTCPAATILSVIDETQETKSPSPETQDRKIEIPHVVVDDKHKKMRHYPLTREQRPKSYTTPGLQSTVPGEIRFLHPSVSQETNKATLPEYRLEAQIKTRERCRKGCLCIVFTLWTLVTTGSIILLSK